MMKNKKKEKIKEVPVEVEHRSTDWKTCLGSSATAFFGSGLTDIYDIVSSNRERICFN